MRIPRGRFERIVADALDDLPAWVQERLDNVEVLVEDNPPEESGLLGLYEGTPLTRRGMNYSGVLLAREWDVGERDIVGLQRPDHLLGLAGGDDQVLQALEQDDRTGDPIGEVRRRSLTVDVLRFGVGADQRVEVARFELVRVLHER